MSGLERYTPTFPMWDVNMDFLQIYQIYLKNWQILLILSNELDNLKESLLISYKYLVKGDNIDY